MVITILLYLLLGALAGIIAGLFGVGGGVIIVPALIYSFSQQGLPAEVLTHMAVATSLAAICFTSIASVTAHQKNRFVLWPVVRRMLIGLIAGSMLGVLFADQLSGFNLQLLIGSFLLIVALQMMLSGRSRASQQAKPATPSGFIAAMIGALSAMFGIGGGSMTVPYLNHIGLRMQQAVATSAACGVPIAYASLASNLYLGWHKTDAISYSLGYVYWPALLGITIMSMPFARVGAGLAKNLSAQKLQRLFAVFLAMIGSLIIFTALGFL